MVIPQRSMTMTTSNGFSKSSPKHWNVLDKTSTSPNSPTCIEEEESNTTELDVIYKKDRTSLAVEELLRNGMSLANGKSFETAGTVESEISYPNDDHDSVTSSLSSSSGYEGNHHQSLDEALNRIINRTVGTPQELDGCDEKRTSKASLSSWKSSQEEEEGANGSSKRTSVTSKSSYSYFIPGITGRARCLEKASPLSSSSVHIVPKLIHNRKSRRTPRSKSTTALDTTQTNKIAVSNHGKNHTTNNNNNTKNAVVDDTNPTTTRKNVRMDKNNTKKTQNSKTTLPSTIGISTTTPHKPKEVGRRRRRRRASLAMTNTMDETNIESRIQQHHDEIDELIQKETSIMESAFYIPGITERSRRLVTKNRWRPKPPCRITTTKRIIQREGAFPKSVLSSF
mmetsp:Transcript_13682/g.21375  ORF Transcript_13682/g.21375 Transcript_13682/m.21375 type:complete len:397 (+) Transcript_13682:101-1291(+)